MVVCRILLAVIVAVLVAAGIIWVAVSARDTNNARSELERQNHLAAKRIQLLNQ